MIKSAKRPLSISFIDDDLDEDISLNKVEIPSEKFAKKEISDISGLMRFTPFHRNVESQNIEDSASQINGKPENTGSKSNTPKSNRNIGGKSPRGSNRFMPVKSPFGSSMNINLKKAGCSPRKQARQATDTEQKRLEITGLEKIMGTLKEFLNKLNQVVVDRDKFMRLYEKLHLKYKKLHNEYEKKWMGDALFSEFQRSIGGAPQIKAFYEHFMRNVQIAAPRDTNNQLQSVATKFRSGQLAKTTTSLAEIGQGLITKGQARVKNANSTRSIGINLLNIPAKPGQPQPRTSNDFGESSLMSSTRSIKFQKDHKSTQDIQKAAENKRQEIQTVYEYINGIITNYQSVVDNLFIQKKYKLRTKQEVIGDINKILQSYQAKTLSKEIDQDLSLPCYIYKIFSHKCPKKVKTCESKFTKLICNAMAYESQNFRIRIFIRLLGIRQPLDESNFITFNNLATHMTAFMPGLWSETDEIVAVPLKNLLSYFETHSPDGMTTKDMLGLEAELKSLPRHQKKGTFRKETLVDFFQAAITILDFLPRIARDFRDDLFYSLDVRFLPMKNIDYQCGDYQLRSV
jgi:hypothetical protein